MAVALAIVAGVAGATYVGVIMSAGGKPRFYQGEFGPAVMTACGRGYLNPDPAGIPGLQDFLATTADSFSCDAIPATPPLKALTPMQVAFRYQELAVAWSWKLTNVSWSSLGPLYGAMFAVTAVATYGLMRMAGGIVLASAATLALIASTIQLIYLPHIRDYSKAPFLLVAILGLAAIVRFEMRASRLIALGAAFGLWLGLGVGFRNDLLIVIPPFIVTVLLFARGPLRMHWKARAAAIAACVVALWLAMWPMRAIYAPGGGNSMQHVVLLGLGAEFNRDLGVDNGGLYDWIYDFKDEYAHAIGSAYGTRMWGATHALPLYGGEYDRAASGYLTAVIKSFPADMLTRTYASMLRVLGIPYNKTSLQPPTLLSHPQWLRVYQVRERVLRVLGAIWPWLIGITLVGAAAHDLRMALFLVLLVAYFGAYPVLQFNERHMFHLEFMAWWAMVAPLQGLIAWTTRRVRGGDTAAATPLRSRLIRATAATAVLAAIIVLPMPVLRAYQDSMVREELQRYERLPRRSLDRRAVPAGDGWSRVAAPPGPAALAGHDAVTSELVVAEFDTGACDALSFDVTFRYTASAPIYDFSRTLQVRPPLDGGTRRIFFPVYRHPSPSATIEGSYDFAGLDLPADAVPCLTGWSQVTDVNGLALLPTLNLPAGWQQTTLHMTIPDVESRVDVGGALDVYTFPPGLAVGRLMMASTIAPVTPDQIAQRSPTLDTSSSTWQVDGAGGVGGRGPFLYLAQMQPRRVRAGDRALVQGRLESGGLSVGLVRDSEWVAQIPVLTPGDFVVVLQVPEDGDYSLIVANNLPGRSLHNRLSILRIGWVPAIP